jgi:hypothetical protein
MRVATSTGVPADGLDCGLLAGLLRDESSNAPLAAEDACAELRPVYLSGTVERHRVMKKWETTASPISEQQGSAAPRSTQAKLEACMQLPRPGLGPARHYDIPDACNSGMSVMSLAASLRHIEEAIRTVEDRCRVCVAPLEVSSAERTLLLLVALSES